MTPEIDPAQVTCVLEVLALLGIGLDAAWAEVQATQQPSGEHAVALALRLVLDDGLLVRHVSTLAADETLGDAIERVSLAMQNKGLRSVDVVAGRADMYEQFHTQESVRELTALSGQVVATVLH